MKQFEIPEKLFVTHSEDADKAFSKAVRQELLRRKKLGHSASAWRDGKVVIVPPEEIPVEDDQSKASPESVIGTQETSK